MKTIQLKPNQIITLNDYPLYSNKVLEEYFYKCQLGQDLPFVPVIEKKIVKKYLDSDLLKILKEFEIINPEAKYFMLNGSHRTTASTLTGKKITVAVFQNDKDIIEAKQLIPIGQIRKDDVDNHTLIENYEILKKYFQEKPYFMTVEQKTKKLIKENKIPSHIIDYFNNISIIHNS